MKTGSGSAFQTVEYTQDVVNGPLSTISASKEVLLAAGVIGTPQILLNSGIGDSSYLSSIGIPPLVNLPSVGRNLTDQPTTGCLWSVRSDADTFDPVFQDENVLDSAMAEWTDDGTGPLVVTPIGQVAFFRLNETELIDLGVPSGVDYAAGPNTPHLEMAIGVRLCIILQLSDANILITERFCVPCPTPRQMAYHFYEPRLSNFAYVSCQVLFSKLIFFQVAPLHSTQLEASTPSGHLTSTRHFTPPIGTLRPCVKQ